MSGQKQQLDVIKRRLIIEKRISAGTEYSRINTLRVLLEQKTPLLLQLICSATPSISTHNYISTLSINMQFPCLKQCLDSMNRPLYILFQPQAMLQI